MNGVLCIDKPTDYTSFDVVAVCRRLCNTRKIGHAGTLDPNATGVLPILVGTAAKALSFLPSHEKEYEAKFITGIVTSTGDIWGEKLQDVPQSVDITEVEQVLPDFEGDIIQTPPMVSAIRINGKRLYEYAREGKSVDVPPRAVTVSELRLTGGGGHEFSLYCRCSAGTYIRSIITDIGERLGCGATMSYLRRTRACGIHIDSCITLGEARVLTADGLLYGKITPVDSLLQDYPAVYVSAAQFERFLHGGWLDLARIPSMPDSERVRVYSPNGDFAGLGHVDGDTAQLAVLRLFMSPDPR